MERYHDTTADPLPLYSPRLEEERQRIEQATAEFLAKGGAVQRVGYQMKDHQVWVINPKKTPVYAHLFEPPQPDPLHAKPAPTPAPAVPPAPVQKQLVAPRAPTKVRPAEATSPQLAARLMVQAKLGATPKAAAEAIGITEKHARQLAREFRIQFKRQR